LFQADGLGTFSGPTIAAEYTCVNGVQILTPGTQFYSLDEIVYAVVQKRSLYFNATLTLASKIPAVPWNSTTHFWVGGLPQQYNVTLAAKKIQVTVAGRAVFTKDDKIKELNFGFASVVGILSLLQQTLPSDPLYQLTAFCLSIQDACRSWVQEDRTNNLPTFGYGDPMISQTAFLGSCLGAIIGSRMPSNGSPFFEVNSYTCRAYHLGMAFINPDIHCPHSSLLSNVCVGSEIYQCQ